MNENFWSLSEERQQNIINAALEVFSQNEYKRASTDLIAAKAGISKGLLFYYFHNKKELYLFLYDYVTEMMKEQIVDTDFLYITDFYELLKYASGVKVRILEKNSYLLDFAMRAFYSDKEEVSDALQEINFKQGDLLYQAYFRNVDMGKFKEGTDPYRIFKMLIWMADGYLHELRVKGYALEIHELEQEFDNWMEMMRQMTYKEEYL